ncbi:MAG: BadF/BadG/BcrA/BcrD ATPase family protein [Lachnospiraceae bacterium]
MYLLGIDAGGSKTHCVIADEQENIVGEAVAGAAQHQIYGIEQTEQSLQEAVDRALENAGLRLADIEYGVFGMSGADGEEDFALLVPIVQKLMQGTPFRVVHDAWIGFYSATEEDMGIASICGTGAGHVGRNRRGEILRLRNLDYIMGNYGGGADIADKALHYAFRSEEGTWEKSLLEEMVPAVFGVEGMPQVCDYLLKKELTKEQSYRLPIVVFEAAERGDQVAQEIIRDMGYQEGRYASAIIRRLGMEKEKVPLVLIGSIFRTKSPYIIEPYLAAVQEICPDAYVIIPDQAPVLGAIRIGRKLATVQNRG